MGHCTLVWGLLGPSIGALGEPSWAFWVIRLVLWARRVELLGPSIGTLGPLSGTFWVLRVSTRGSDPLDRHSIPLERPRTVRLKGQECPPHDGSSAPLKGPKSPTCRACLWPFWLCLHMASLWNVLEGSRIFFLPMEHSRKF